MVHGRSVALWPLGAPVPRDSADSSGTWDGVLLLYADQATASPSNCSHSPPPRQRLDIFTDQSSALASARWRTHPQEHQCQARSS